jgi:hydroxymethylpyrimidine pyrophosphatase-like HAD family hydrolase
MKVLSELFWRTWMEPWSRRTRCLPQKRQAVGRLAEAGILFAITSGRPPRGMQTLIRDLNITTVIAGFNGGVYTSPRLDPIVMRDLPKTATARAIEIIREGGLVPRLYTDTVWYVQDPKGPHVERESKTVGFGPEVTSDYSAYVAQAPKIVGVGDDLEAVANCEKKVREELSDHVSAARSQPYYLDVTHRSPTKGAWSIFWQPFISFPRAVSRRWAICLTTVLPANSELAMKPPLANDGPVQ